MQLGDVIDGMLDPALRRRGFANRELLTNWSSIVPTPWGSATMPDKLVWPRKDRPDPDGAVLYVRCIETHKVMLAHDAPLISRAINRYFGYLLVRSVRLSLNPLSLARPPQAPPSKPLDPETRNRIARETEAISSPDLREALEKLGRGVLGKAGN